MYRAILLVALLLFIFPAYPAVGQDDAADEFLESIIVDLSVLEMLQYWVESPDEGLLLPDGYSFMSFLVSDQKAVVFAALPPENSNMSGYFIDTQGNPGFLLDYGLKEDIWWIDVLKGIMTEQEDALSETGEYSYCESGRQTCPRNNIDIFLTPGRDDYVAAYLTEYGFPYDTQLYCSVTDSIYIVIGYDPEIYSSCENIRDYDEIINTASRARSTLRSIGSSQLAYQGTHDPRVFGTFSDLKDDLYIAAGYTMENMIEDHIVYWCCNQAKSDFVVVVMPVVHEDIFDSFLINERQTIWQLEAADVGTVDEEWEEIIGLENDYYAVNGSYGWPEDLGFTSWDSSPEIYVSETADYYFLMVPNLPFEAITANEQIMYFSATGTFYKLLAVL